MYKPMLLLLILLLAGCDEDTVPLPTQQALQGCEARSGAVNSQGSYAIDTASLLEGGGVHVHWAGMYYTSEPHLDNPIDRGGVPVQVKRHHTLEFALDGNYSWPLDPSKITHPGCVYTNRRGFCFVESGHTAPPYDGQGPYRYQYGFASQLRLVNDLDEVLAWTWISGGYCENSSVGKVGYYEPGGLYYLSQSNIRDGHLLFEEYPYAGPPEQRGQTIVCQGTMNEPTGHLLNNIGLSDAETQFLSDESITTNEVGFDVLDRLPMRAVHKKQDGVSLMEFVGKEETIYRLPHHIDSVLVDNANMQYVSARVVSKPCDIVGQVLDGRIQLCVSNAEPNLPADPNVWVPITWEVVASSQDRQRHIVHSSLFVAVDPNGFDPYWLDIPAGPKFLVAPMGHQVRVEFTDGLNTLGSLIQYWLGNSPSLDLNKDGIVNLKDYIYYQS